MNASIRILCALALAGAFTQAGAQAPTQSLDLDAVKPKSAAATITGNLIGGPQQATNQKTAAAGATNGSTPGGIGSTVKNPLGTKTGIGVIGGPGSSSANTAQADKDAAASSTDVQVKIPLKK